MFLKITSVTSSFVFELIMYKVVIISNIVRKLLFQIFRGNLIYIIMNSMELGIPLHSLYWSIHTKDESKRGIAFAFIFGVNWLWRCSVTASFVVGMTSFMEFMIAGDVWYLILSIQNRQEEPDRRNGQDRLTLDRAAWQNHLTLDRRTLQEPCCHGTGEGKALSICWASCLTSSLDPRQMMSVAAAFACFRTLVESKQVGWCRFRT